MIVRMRFQQGPMIRRGRGKNRHLAQAFAALLIPAALMGYVLGLWRLGSDLGLTSEFAFSGFFSHWQLWIGFGATLQSLAYALNRYASVGHLEFPNPLPRFAFRPSSHAVPAPALPLHGRMGSRSSRRP